MTEIQIKQKKVQQSATKLNGSSAGQLPNQVRRKKLETKDQKTKREMGEKLNPLNRSRERYANREKQERRKPQQNELNEETNHSQHLDRS